MDPLSLRFVAIFRKDFTFSRKPAMRYILWVAALLGACDIIQDGCHLDAILNFTEITNCQKTLNF